MFIIKTHHNDDNYLDGSMMSSGMELIDKYHGTNMWPTWVMLARDGSQVDLMNLAIRVCILRFVIELRDKNPALMFCRVVTTVHRL